LKKVIFIENAKRGGGKKRVTSYIDPKYSTMSIDISDEHPGPENPIGVDVVKN
jgi:hypothetical protein